VGLDDDGQLFAIATLASICSLSPWFRPAAETLSICGGAAALAYGVGTLFNI
jgi:VIT1/CCC1 family predicted Fe2+/Mn2+ transporter